MKHILKSKFVILLALVGLCFNQTYAQKFAYVDSEWILSQIPDYKSAQKKIDEIAENWQKEIDQKYAQIDKMYKEFQAEKPILTNEQQKQKEDEIIAKERELKAFQNEKFGYEGELFKKRQELIKPIQDKVYDAIQKVAKDNALDFIFDKASQGNMLYTNAKYDKSEEVLSVLGVTVSEKDKPKDNKKQDDNPPSGDLPPR